jgi:TRAP transporter TAXI family solute receptor
MKKIVSVLMVLMMVLALAACGKNNDGGNDGYKYTGDRLTIGGADSTGTMYAAAVQVAATFTNNINGMNVDATTSTGSNENAKKVNSGEIQLGMCSGDAALDAVNGTGKFAESGKQENIRAIGAVYPSLSNWIALKSTGWKYLHDADPKGTYGVGPSASTSESSALLGLEIAGISKENGATFTNVTLGEGANNVADGIMTASTAFAGIPVGAHQSAATTKDCVWLGFTEEELDKIVAKNPAYYKATIPAGTYPKQDADVATFGVKCMVICNKNLGEEEAYQMAKALYEQAEKMAEASAVFFMMKEKAFIGTDLPIPLHPGAEKFYKEVGLIK